MLQHLFKSVGFGWGVRISGLVSAACCITAALTVTTFSPPKKTELCVGIKTFTDTPYVLLAIGSCLVALGMFELSILKTFLIRLSKVYLSRSSISLNTPAIFLFRPIRPSMS